MPTDPLADPGDFGGVTLDSHNCRRPGPWGRRKIKPQPAPHGGDGFRRLFVCPVCGRAWAWVSDEEGHYWMRYPWADARFEVRNAT